MKNAISWKNDNGIREESQISCFEAIKKIREQLSRDQKESYIFSEHYYQ
jgi:hypothetical protein